MSQDRNSSKTVGHDFGCCTNDYTRFLPRVILCYKNYNCAIDSYETYFSFRKKFNFCEKCFAEVEDPVALTYNNMDFPEMKIPKCEFQQHTNKLRIPEPLVKCQECDKMQHAICVLHNDCISPQGFKCDVCLKNKSSKRAENIYTCENLDKSFLSCHIEARVDNFLQLKRVDTCKVNIRVVSTVDKMMNIAQTVKDRYAEAGHVLVDMPYRSKVILAFQLIDGVDVCFLSMTVQEYDSECPSPNTRKVNISYVDSVKFFKPKEYRTDVYHEILLGYLDYVKKLGYTSAYIWSSSAIQGKNYLFNQRPIDQMMPNDEKLAGWYHRLLKKGILEGIVLKYDQKLEVDKYSLAAYPYFKGDFWPSIIDITIRHLNYLDEAKIEQQVKALKVGDNTNNSNMEIQHKDNSASAAYNFKESLIKHVTDVVGSQFFIIQLNCNKNSLIGDPIMDPDYLDVKYIAEDSFSFKVSASHRYLEFSSLRRAKYSTMILIYHLIHQYEDHFISTCNICQGKIINDGYKCDKCKYFNLCSKCINIKPHPHQMINFEISLTEQELWWPSKHSSNSYSMHREWFNKHMQMIYHSYFCKDDNCRFIWCSKLRFSFKCNCYKKSLGGCPTCKSLMDMINYHAENCTRLYCDMPYCQELQINNRIKKDITLLNDHQNHLLMRKHLNEKFS